MSLGERMRYYREKEGISQALLARLVGVHVQVIKLFEADQGQPLCTMLTQIATILGVGVSDLATPEQWEFGRKSEAQVARMEQEERMRAEKQAGKAAIDAMEDNEFARFSLSLRLAGLNPPSRYESYEVLYAGRAVTKAEAVVLRDYFAKLYKGLLVLE